MQDLSKQSPNARLDEVNERKNIQYFEVERMKRKELITYSELINRTCRIQKKVVQASPIVYLVVPTSEGPLSKMLQNLRFGGVDDEDNRIIMEIALCKCKECLEVIIPMHIRSGDQRLETLRTGRFFGTFARSRSIHVCPSAMEEM